MVGIPACLLAIWQLRSLGGRLLMLYGFVLNTVAFLALGLVYIKYPEGDANAPLEAKWIKFGTFVLVMFSLNWGPNLATYVMPVQVFPKSIRGSFHGLSAASGKLGAALGSFLYPLIAPSKQAGLFGNGAATIFLLQVAVNLLGAYLAYANLPKRPAAKEKSEDSAEVYKSLLAVN